MATRQQMRADARRKKKSTHHMRNEERKQEAVEQYDEWMQRKEIDINGEQVRLGAAIRSPAEMSREERRRLWRFRGPIL